MASAHAADGALSIANTGCHIIETVPASGASGWAVVRDGRAEPDDVAVWIDHGTLMLSPCGVLRTVDLHSRGAPLLGEGVGVVHEQVRRPSVVVRLGCHAQVKLHAVTGGKAVASRWISPHGEAEAPVVIHRYIKITDWEDWRNPV